MDVPKLLYVFKTCYGHIIDILCNIFHFSCSTVWTCDKTISGTHNGVQFNNQGPLNECSYYYIEQCDTNTGRNLPLRLKAKKAAILTKYGPAVNRIKHTKPDYPLSSEIKRIILFFFIKTSVQPTYVTTKQLFL